MKNCFCGTSTFKNFALLLARLIVGGIFIYAGWMKIVDIPAASAGFAASGFPIPTFFAYLVALTELIGGAALVLGLFTKFVSIIFVIEMIVAVVVVILSGYGIMMAQLPLAMVAGSAALAASGAGEWRVYKKECCCELS